jgi:protein required for attachment to host cells
VGPQFAAFSLKSEDPFMNKDKLAVDLTNSDQWFVVANRASAEIYREGPDHVFFLVLRLTNPEGSLQEQDLDSDKPGRGYSSAGGGTIHHSLDRRSHQHEEVARKFARAIIKKTEEKVNDKNSTQLVLIAEPHFLGLLRDALTPRLKKLVKETITKEFGLKSTEEMQRLIHSAIQAKRPLLVDPIQEFMEDLRQN